MKGLSNIFVLFSRFVPADKLQTCSMMGKFGEHASLDTFSTDVDPNKILERAAGGGYIHSEHNVVRYYERVEIDIMIFLLSDFARVIVEVQMTMLLVPLLHGQFKMTTTLRSLTLIDATFSQVSNYGTNIMFPMRTTIKPASNLKRKIGYHDEEISSTREKLSRMDLDDTARREKGNQETIEHLD